MTAWPFVTSIVLVIIGSSLRPALCQNSVIQCGTGMCSSNQYCRQGQTALCIDCNVACNGCRGPNNDECVSCQTGFQAAGSACIQCPMGQFGRNCSGICHCLDETCDSVNGHCSGKCQKGYYKPPECQEECPDLNYGLDCVFDCHCYNSSVCDKALGFCPNNLCHPDWTGVGCSKRLPQIASAPTVSYITCAYVTLTWPGWNSLVDFGDISLPVFEYRLYWRQNGTTSSWTRSVTLLHNPSWITYSSNVTNLPGDRYYQFRVDVHFTDDGKVVDTAGPGIATLPPVFVLCTTITTPASPAVPVIVGSSIVESVTAINQPDGSMLVTWSIAPDLRNFLWNITVIYRIIGIGDCALGTPSAVTSVVTRQNETSYRILAPPGWTHYQVALTAQGQGSISTANGTKTITPVTAEILPSGNVSDVGAEELQATAATLRWTAVPCKQRGGVLLHYDVMLRQVDAGWTLNVTSNFTSARVEGLTPYTSYSATVRYVNSVGPGPWGPAWAFDTAEAVPAAVSIAALAATTTTITLNLYSPVPANGVILDFDVTYSTDTAFALTQTATLTFKTPLTGALLIGSLLQNTVYYIKARARTNAGYGSYGHVVLTTTLPATAAAPAMILQSGRNVSCVTVTWLPPHSSPVAVTGYRVTVTDADTLTLPANVTTSSSCGLQSGTTFAVTVTSLSGDGAAGEATSLTLSTEVATPATPTAPVLLSVSTTTTTVVLDPVDSRDVTAYILKVQILAATGTRKKRSALVPGYETAVLGPGQVTGGTLFTVGDGLPYGGALNRPLEPGRRYMLHYLVRASANNETKFSHVTMDQPFTTILPTLPTTVKPPTSTALSITPFLINTKTATTAQPAVVAAAGGDDNNAALSIVIVVLSLVALLALVVVVVHVVWSRRRLGAPRPKAEPGEEKSDPVTSDPGLNGGDPHVPERYWSRIVTDTDSRYIVAGLDVVPERQLTGEARSFRDEFKSLPHHAIQLATRVAARYPALNRFYHLLAYDHTRVTLHPDASSGATYINASWLSGYRRSRRYVAAQSPYNDETAVDMWRLIHQHRVKTVVLIANIVEDGIVKCTQFWPQGQGTLGHFDLKLRRVQVYADLVVREVAVSQHQGQTPHLVMLFHFTSWPDHGVPSSAIPFLDLRYKVRQYHGDDPGPIVVHCGTGVARTGVFIAVDSLIDQYAVEGRISVFTFVRNMRKERPRMVRTYKQYVFIYDCILDFFQAGKFMMDSTGTVRTFCPGWIAWNEKKGLTWLQDQFQLLQRLTRGPSAEQCLAAALPVNVKRNRNPDVIPSDQHRPRLISPSSLSKTDYINAIFVDGYRKRNRFILTQDPLHTTLGDFWRLVYDHRVTTIVMMDAYRHPDDAGAEYWPTDGLVLKFWEPLFVELTACYQQANVTIRSLRVVSMLFPHLPHLVRQFHFQPTWAQRSFTTPVKGTRLLELLDNVRHHHSQAGRPQSPILVHCRDGATHSGLLVTLALVCERMEEEEEVDVYHVVKHVKRRRPQVISHYDQYRFLHQTLRNYATLRMSGSSNHRA